MQSQERNINYQTGHLTEIEKNVLDEYILDIKNIPAMISLHEENCRVRYDEEQGKGASFRLLKNHVNYMVVYGEFNKEEAWVLYELLKEQVDL